MNNSILIKHQNGDCLFRVKSVEMSILDTGLDIEIESEENNDCCLGFLPSPTLYMENVSLSAKSIDGLMLEKIEIPLGWEDEDGIEKDSDICRIYIGQHLSLDNNHVMIRKRSDDEFEINWSSDALDFRYYDERAIRNEVVVNAIFRIAK